MNHDSINHDGQVVEISDNKVVAEILVSEACGTCQAKGLCHTNGKKVRVEAEAEPGQDLKVGQQVKVSFTPTLALSSVLLAYVLPLVLMFAVMFSLASGLNSSCPSNTCSVTVLDAPEIVSTIIS